MASIKEMIEQTLLENAVLRTLGKKEGFTLKVPYPERLLRGKSPWSKMVTDQKQQSKLVHPSEEGADTRSRSDE